MTEIHHQFEVFADYFQLYPKDEVVRSPVELNWDKETLLEGCITRPGFIAISTARNMPVPVIMEIHTSCPDDSTLAKYYKEAEHVVTCSIEISSGRLLIMGPTDYFPDASRISIAPGVYACMVFCSGLTTVSDDGLDGEDTYKFVLYPGKHVQTQVPNRFTENRS